MTCPECGSARLDGAVECLHRGVIFAKWQQAVDFFQRSRWHRALAIATMLLLVATLPVHAQDRCGTSEENTRYALDVNAQVQRSSRLATHASLSVPQLKDGVFYLQADELTAPYGHDFDLGGQSLVFTPRGNGRYALQREASRWREPQGAVVREFSTTSPHYVRHDLPFAIPLFGQNVTAVYLSATNGIYLAPPALLTADQVDDAELAGMREAVVSPLLLTGRRMAQLFWPDLYVDALADRVVVTWRAKGKAFAYDVQAELHANGTIVFNYGALRDVNWGAPLIHPGLAWRTEQALGGANDATNDTGPQGGALAPMLDLTRVDVARLGNSNVISIRLEVAAPIDPTKIPAGQRVHYYVYLGTTPVQLDVLPDGSTTVYSPTRRPATGGNAATFSGDTIELLLQQELIAGNVTNARAYTAYAYSQPVDQVTVPLAKLEAPAQRVVDDLSSIANGTELEGVIGEAFVRPTLNVGGVWDRLRNTYGLREADFDGVAIYQSFYTDIIFYAGAYSTVGNPQVDGIAPPSSTFGLNAGKRTALLHMNHLTYGWNAAEETSSSVILHEFGHRWLYHLRIREGDANTRSLNPSSAHPAAFVHAPAAFPVFGENESSTMGGAIFNPVGSGTYETQVANRGFSWTELYLMGLASKEEVQPWFYLAGTSPALRLEYWPDDAVTVSGERRDVTVDQIVSAVGPRKPDASASAKNFRVLFVLVTPSGQAPTSAELARMTELRSIFERTFHAATGGRAEVSTGYSTSRRRSVRR
ncbi:MAG TPA: hypothetical protein VGF69_19325 [Thermoanaerobaculia bacterium]